MPLCPSFEHRLIVACRLCPVGSYAKTGKLTICVLLGGRLACVFDTLHPSRLVKASERSCKTVPLTVSIKTTIMDSKDVPPVLFSWTSTHQPVPVQLSIPL